jgi:hypothetical protein
MIPLELISMAGGATAGFIFRLIAEGQKDRAAQFNRMMQAIDKSNEGADLAAKRVPNDKAGNMTRRFIIVAVLFGVILAPFLLTLLNKTTIVEVTTPIRSWLGLFETGGHTRFYELPSYLLSKELLSSLIAIITFYFGSSVGKRY